MKKLLLILVLGVFTFGASGFGTMQQNDIDNPQGADCFTIADTEAELLGAWLGLSYESEFKIFEIIYNDCLEN